MENLKQTLTQLKSSNGNSPAQPVFEVPQYDHIDLELEETEEALRRAREEKHFRIERMKYLKRISKPMEYQKHTAEELFAMLEQYGYKFANKSHETQVKAMCCYFAKDGKRSPLDMKKGILLSGDIGNGKTSLMQFFKSNQLQPFRIEKMLEVTSDYKISGEASMKSYSQNIKATPNIYGLDTVGYCFDDIGTEEIPARHYAETKNVFAEIILNRYELPHNSTHATTNKDVKELETIYGSRVYDRMKEMFNVIIFEHESFR
jgi:DNA replication protein DnaC